MAFDRIHDEKLNKECICYPELAAPFGNNQLPIFDNVESLLTGLVSDKKLRQFLKWIVSTNTLYVHLSWEVQKIVVSNDLDPIRFISASDRWILLQTADLSLYKHLWILNSS